MKKQKILDRVTLGIEEDTGEPFLAIMSKKQSAVYVNITQKRVLSNAEQKGILMRLMECFLCQGITELDSYYAKEKYTFKKEEVE